MGNLSNHLYLGLPAHQPRVWVDLSCVASKRAGLAMHCPGRKILRWMVAILRCFAWLPIGRFRLGPIRCFEELPGAELIEELVTEPLDYIAFYMGNGSLRSKYTILLVTQTGKHYIAKLGRTPEAKKAIQNEAEVLKFLNATSPGSLCGAIPELVQELTTRGAWSWSVQTQLPKGRSERKFGTIHRQFLASLHALTSKDGKVLVHGDFAPWNMSILDGRLYVYDWEDAHLGAKDEDERWFKKQVKTLLGVNPE